MFTIPIIVLSTFTLSPVNELASTWDRCSFVESNITLNCPKYDGDGGRIMFSYGYTQFSGRLYYNLDGSSDWLLNDINFRTHIYFDYDDGSYTNYQYVTSSFNQSFTNQSFDYLECNMTFNYIGQDSLGNDYLAFSVDDGSYVVTTTQWNLTQNLYFQGLSTTFYDLSNELDFSNLFNQIQNYVDSLNSESYGSFTTGYDEGYNNGYSQGLEDGGSSGYQTGYADGYSQGVSQDGAMSAIFGGIINIALLPINFFLAMLNFEVFGINIGSFVASLMTIAIVVMVIRMIFSGGNKSSD